MSEEEQTPEPVDASTEEAAASSDIPAELQTPEPVDVSRAAKHKGRTYKPSPEPPEGNRQSINELRLRQQERDKERLALIQESVDLILEAIADLPNDPLAREIAFEQVRQAFNKPPQPQKVEQAK